MSGLCLEGMEEVSGILRSGVYALALRGEVIYIGQSRSLYSRIYTHRHLARNREAPSWLKAKGIVFDQVFIRLCPVHELDRVERELIALYKPRLNTRLQTAGPILAPVTLPNGVVLNAPPRPNTELRRI